MHIKTDVAWREVDICTMYRTRHANNQKHKHERSAYKQLGEYLTHKQLDTQTTRHTHICIREETHKQLETQACVGVDTCLRFVHTRRLLMSSESLQAQHSKTARQQQAWCICLLLFTQQHSNTAIQQHSEKRRALTTTIQGQVEALDVEAPHIPIRS